MAKTERRGFFGYFTRKPSMSDKRGTNSESGPSAPQGEEPPQVMKAYSKRWFGGPPSARKPKAEVKEEAPDEAPEAPKEDPVIEQVPIEAIAAVEVAPNEDSNPEPVPENKLVKRLTKFGIPVALAAAVCAAVIKIISQ